MLVYGECRNWAREKKAEARASKSVSSCSIGVIRDFAGGIGRLSSDGLLQIWSGGCDRWSLSGRPCFPTIGVGRDSRTSLCGGPTWTLPRFFGRSEATAQNWRVSITLTLFKGVFSGASINYTKFVACDSCALPSMVASDEQKPYLFRDEMSRPLDVER
jgi:hypothetical protein